jgi:plastocyanin
MKRILLLSVVLLSACSRPETPSGKAEAAIEVFRPDPATAGSVTGTVIYAGPRPAPVALEMDSDPACARMHKGALKVDPPVSVSRGGELANVFVYVKSGLDGKHFGAPETPVTIDQKGCWFHPRVMGIQTGQTLEVTNSDPVTHNIHPVAQVNREWNQSQSEGDPPLKRRFARPEIMVPVKCNIHKWMHAWIGVLEHPYFGVTGPGGTFTLANLPPGEYTIATWHETLGEQEQRVTVPPSGQVTADFRYAAK